LAESTVNAIISKRFAKRHQMQWTKRGRTCSDRTERALSTARSAPSSNDGTPASPMTVPRTVLTPRQRPTLRYALLFSELSVLLFDAISLYFTARAARRWASAARARIIGPT
jgi:hypothetical protein